MFDFKPLPSEDHERYVALSVQVPRRQFLDAIDAERRSLELHLHSPELLRRGTNRAQKARMAELRKLLRQDIVAQMRRGERRRFRGPVSIEIDLHAVSTEAAASSPPAVKAYLDLLQGPVYEDDRSVRHLRVARHARDNPTLREPPEDWLYAGERRRPRGPAEGVDVRIRVLPMRLYTTDFDRAFDLREQVFGDSERYRSWDHQLDHPFWAVEWRPNEDDDRLSVLRAEHRDDLENRGLYELGGFYDTETMRGLRLAQRHRREREIRALRHRLFLDQRPQDYDRPGPRSELDELLWKGMGEHADLLRDRDLLMPGSFFLPLPPEAHGDGPWKRTVTAAMAEHRERFPGFSAEPLDRALALDIAVRGAGANRRDLDNLARDILVPFEESYCAGRRGTVVSYRVYEAEGPRDEVRVLVMADERLHQLEDAIAKARNWILLHGPQFR